MAIEDYMSCNELDNLQHNGQNVSTLNTTTRLTLRHNQLNSFNQLFNSFDAQMIFRQMPLTLRC